MPNWLDELRSKIQTFREEGNGTVLADGNEQTISEYVGEGKLYAYIDLSTMQGGDTCVIRQYLKIKPGGEYGKYADESYVGVQSLPMLCVMMKPAKYGMKITLQQSAGVNRSYDWQTFIESGLGKEG